jgi:hypothetical protein
MRSISSCLALALLVLGSQNLVAQEPTPPADTTSPAPAAVPVSPIAAPITPTPVPTLVDDIIKLWKANLSENFLKKYVSSSDVAKELTAEDIVRLRNAGLPEDLILAITQRKLELAATPSSPAATAGATAAGVHAAAVVPAQTPVPTPPTTARWEGLARRNDGIVLFKSRWDPGVLEFKDETLRWTDSKDVAKNRVIAVKSLTEQQLTCLKKPGGNECFEWVAKTRTDEYRFRNVAWEQNENARIQEIYTFLKTLDRNLVSSQVPVAEK